MNSTFTGYSIKRLRNWLVELKFDSDIKHNGIIIVINLEGKRQIGLLFHSTKSESSLYLNHRFALLSNLNRKYRSEKIMSSENLHFIKLEQECERSILDIPENLRPPLVREFPEDAKYMYYISGNDNSFQRGNVDQLTQRNEAIVELGIDPFDPNMPFLFDKAGDIVAFFSYSIKCANNRWNCKPISFPNSTPLGLVQNPPIPHNQPASSTTIGEILPQSQRNANMDNSVSEFSASTSALDINSSTSTTILQGHVLTSLTSSGSDQSASQTILHGLPERLNIDNNL